MGASDLKKAFNEVTGKDAVCMLALLEYDRAHDTEFQTLYFSGNWADGSGFSIKSNPIRPGVDVNQAARETAERLLQQART